MEVLEKLGQKETVLWQTWPVGSGYVSPLSPFLGPVNEEDHENKNGFTLESSMDSKSRGGGSSENRILM